MDFFDKLQQLLLAKEVEKISVPDGSVKKARFVRRTRNAVKKVTVVNREAEDSVGSSLDWLPPTVVVDSVDNFLNDQPLSDSLSSSSSSYSTRRNENKNSDPLPKSKKTWTTLNHSAVPSHTPRRRGSEINQSRTNSVVEDDIFGSFGGKNKPQFNNQVESEKSAAIVTEFLDFSINYILSKRKVFDDDIFAKLRKFGVNLEKTKDVELKLYLQDFTNQLQEWVSKHQVVQVAIELMNPTTFDVLERWAFDIAECKPETEGKNDGKIEAYKTEKEIIQQISGIFTQIIPSVAYLPDFQQSITYDLLILTAADLPSGWEEVEARTLSKSTRIRYRSFSTNFHTCNTTVSSKVMDPIHNQRHP